MDFSRCTIRPTTEADHHLPTFDNTKLVAINTCPRWGLIRYDQHKRMPGEGRSTALEMGTAAHVAFAAIRFFQLLEFGRETYGSKYRQSVVDAAGARVLGKDFYSACLRIFKSKEDQRRRVNAIAIYAANNAGYYDDPSDKRRTISNLENSLIAYIDRLPLTERIPYVDWSSGFVGVEVGCDVVVSFYENDDLHTEIRFTGKIDGVVLDGGTVQIDDNKTASRLDKSWEDSLALAHQFTGYMMAVEAMIGKPISEGMVRGMMVPLPKTYDMGGLANIPIERDEWRKREWYRWVWNTLGTYFQHKDDPLNAPEYTHSCNRYFRSCSFIPLCAMADPEERAISYEQMVHDEWNPLHELE